MIAIKGSLGIDPEGREATAVPSLTSSIRSFVHCLLGLIPSTTSYVIIKMLSIIRRGLK